MDRLRLQLRVGGLLCSKMRKEMGLESCARIYFIGDIWIIGIDGYVMMLDNIDEIEYIEGLDVLDIKLKDGNEFRVKGKNVDELKVFLEILKTRERKKKEATQHHQCKQGC